MARGKKDENPAENGKVQGHKHRDFSEVTGEDRVGTMERVQEPLPLPAEETLFRVKNSVQNLSFAGVSGGLLLTNFRLIFTPHPIPPSSQPLERLVNLHAASFWIPNSAIAQVEKVGGRKRQNVGGEVYGLVITTKDFQTIRLAFPTSSDDRGTIYKKLQPFIAAQDEASCFAFQYVVAARDSVSKECGSGWDVYDPVADFARMGVPESEWRWTSINHDYSLCSTYPRELMVPKSVRDELVKECGKFRSRSRIPALAWRHPRTGASLCRSAQPLPGIPARRSPADEDMLNAIRIAHASHSLGSGESVESSNLSLFVLDSRPQANAIGNKLMGKGFEGSSYEHMTLEFCGIGNIHVMRESLRGVIGAVNALHMKGAAVAHNSGPDSYWQKVNESQWLQHMQGVLAASTLAVDILDVRGSSVLIHCSDGWDRTAQMSALAQIMIDPHYRTYKGFMQIIEKEWLRFGHKMAQRFAHYKESGSIDKKQRSPIFVQFLDAVHQLIYQFPDQFEFTERFLVAILDEMFGGRFGTFLYNSDRERYQAGLREHTLSMWGHFLLPGVRVLMTNPTYTPTPAILHPSTSLWRLRIWKGYYARWVWLGTPLSLPGAEVPPHVESSFAVEAHPSAVQRGLPFAMDVLPQRESGIVSTLPPAEVVGEAPPLPVSAPPPGSTSCGSGTPSSGGGAECLQSPSDPLEATKIPFPARTTVFGFRGTFHQDVYSSASSVGLWFNEGRDVKLWHARKQEKEFQLMQQEVERLTRALTAAGVEIP